MERKNIHRWLFSCVLLLAPATSFAQVVFSDNFDTQADWRSNQLTQGQGGIGWPSTYAGTCKTYCPPENWSSYRVAQSHWAPNLRDTYLINTDGARGSSGKGLTYNVESTGQWGTWSGGALDKYLGPVGHQELYVRFWLKESPEFCWGSAATNLNAMGKFLRITALRRDPTVNPSLFNPQRYPSPDTCPTFIADAYRRFQPNYGIPAQFNIAQRYAPNYQAAPSENTYPATVPNDSTTGGQGYCGDNKWHSYEFYVKMNSAPDAADGVYRVWLDGKIVAEKIGIPWVKSGVDTNGTVMTTATGWNWVMLADNIDSTAYPMSAQVEMARYIDDVVISTHYSGPPASPVNVVAAAGASSVVLSWAAGSNGAANLIDGYHIYYGADPANLIKVQTVGNVTQSQISGLTAGKYYFAVSGFHKGYSGSNENEGLRSAVVSVTIGSSPTPSPTTSPVPTPSPSPTSIPTPSPSPTSIPSDAIAPAVKVVSPAYGSQVSGTAPVVFSATDNVGVSKVEFYVNGVLKGSTSVAPYTFTWVTTGLADGAYSVRAKAYDAAGNMGQYAVTLYVKNVVDTIAPAIKVVSPAYGSQVRGTVPVVFAATDNVGVSKVEFYVNGVLKGSTSVAPYTFNWVTTAHADGAYSVRAKAYDAAGNMGQYAVTLYVKNVVDTAAPVIKIVSPAYGSQVSGTVPVVFSATDNTAVTKVEFYVNGVLKGSTAVAPYTYNWNTTAFKNGAYSIRAKAYDAAGNMGQYAVTLYVKNRR